MSRGIIIRIDGPPRSGKTTVAQTIWMALTAGADFSPENNGYSGVIVVDGLTMTGAALRKLQYENDIIIIEDNES